MRLYGKNSILERLKSAPETINKIYVAKGVNLEDIARLAREKSITFNHMPENKFSNFTQGIRCQGVVAEVTQFAYSFLEDFLSRKSEDFLSLVFLDHITDPQNLGNIIRTLACLGDFAIVIPKAGSASVNDTVLKVACGAESFVPIAQVANISSALIQAKEKGYWLAGGLTEGGEDLLAAQLPFPLALVMGSEGKGIRNIVREHLDLRLTLPMPGAHLSFNVATATAIFCYEIFRQKKGK